MNHSLPSSSSSLARTHLDDHRSSGRSTVSWGAILAGATAALALQVLFMMLGAGIGLSIYSPITEQTPVANLSVGALIIHSISALIALCLGGWVAGRFSPVHARATGWLHGFVVWCAATVGGVVLVALGAGAMMGGLSKVVGGGFSAMGDSASAVAGGAADALDPSGETVTSFVDEAMSHLPEGRSAAEEIRATREVGLALGRLFNPFQDGNTAANRSAAVTTLVEHTDMSQAEAERTVADWSSSYERLQTDLGDFRESAAAQTREAADSAASAVATFSLWSFFAFLLGALAATGGGHLGAMSARRFDETTGTGTSVPDTSDRV